MNTNFRPLNEVNYKAFLADFNLFLCEWFAERNAAHISETMNGCIFSASVWSKFDLYIRLWEYSGSDIPDMTAIIVRANYYERSKDGRKTNLKEKEHFENLLQFFKTHLPLYGYTNIAIEQPPIHRSGINLSDYGFDPNNRQITYIPLGELKV